MSNPKITSKNLSYDASLPPFLQRLHSSSNSASLDGRHERAIARPKRTRDADADNEDAPVFVDEETGQVVSAEEVRALGAGAESKEAGPIGGDQVAVGDKNEEAMGEEKKQNHTTTIGRSRKRKAGKVIGGDDVAEDDATGEQQRGADKNRKEALSITVPKEKKVVGKGKDKGKKVKLSFGDDEDG